MKNLIKLLLPIITFGCNKIDNKANENDNKQSYSVVKSRYDYNQVLNTNKIDSIEVFSLDAGKLLLPSGKIVIGDPFFIWDRKPLERTIEPGEYRVKLIFINHPTAGKRVAFAQLIFSEKRATKWEMALMGDEEIKDLQEDEFYGFPVDAGLGCFVDLETCKKFNLQMDKLHKANKNHNYYDDVLAEEFKINSFDKSDPKDIGDWVNHYFDEKIKENIIIFSSGYGDGSYPAYWGIDDEEKISSLIIDFLTVELK